MLEKSMLCTSVIINELGFPNIIQYSTPMLFNTLQEPILFLWQEFLVFLAMCSPYIDPEHFCKEFFVQSWLNECVLMQGSMLHGI